MNEKEVQSIIDNELNIVNLIQCKLKEINIFTLECINIGKIGNLTISLNYGIMNFKVNIDSLDAVNFNNKNIKYIGLSNNSNILDNIMTTYYIETKNKVSINKIKNLIIKYFKDIIKTYSSIHNMHYSYN